MNCAIVKNVWIHAKKELFQLVATWLKREMFPSVWKRDVLRNIPKRNDTETFAENTIHLSLILDQVVFFPGSRQKFIQQSNYLISEAEKIVMSR